MKQEPRPLKTWCTIATATAFVSLALLANERSKRVAIEDGLRSSIALMTGLAESDCERDPAVREAITRIAFSSRRGRLQETARAAERTLIEVLPGWRVSGDARLARKASAFLLKHDDLRQRLLDLASRGRSMARDGRDTARLRERIGLALDAAAVGDAGRVAASLDQADEASYCLPFRSGAAAAGSGGTDGEAARAVLLECRHPARVCRELMTEGYQSVEKVILASQALLASGEEELALWSAETAAYLLGLRPLAQRPEQAAESGGEQAGPPPELPEADQGHVRRLIDTAKPLVSGRKASGADVFPADQLLLEAECKLAQGQVRVAALLASAGLNAMGMSDQAIAGLGAAGP